MKKKYIVSLLCLFVCFVCLFVCLLFACLLVCLLVCLFVCCLFGISASEVFLGRYIFWEWTIQFLFGSEVLLILTSRYFQGVVFLGSGLSNFDFVLKVFIGSVIFRECPVAPRYNRALFVKLVVITRIRYNHVIAALVKAPCGTLVEAFVAHRVLAKHLMQPLVKLVIASLLKPSCNLRDNSS